MSVQSEPQRKSVSINTLKRYKQKGEKFASLTAYDFCSAHVVSTQGVDVILVGDSLGMVIQGHDSSLPVTIDDVAYHTQCVNRGNQGAFVIADLPFMSYYSELKSLENSAVLMREGAQMVKLEGGAWLADSTRLLVRHGIPVCAHMGLTPQSINHLGGYRVQGRDPRKAQEMIDEALILQDAGADLILLECVPVALGEKITRTLDVPVIGIGAGPKTDGQIMVLQDMLGLYPGRPAKFVKNFLQGQSEGIQGAIAAYAETVKSGDFPGPEHCYE